MQVGKPGVSLACLSRLVSFSGLDRAIQRGSGDLERPANIRNGVPFFIEISGNTELFRTQGFGSAAFFPLARAAVSPTCVRSLIRFRSNSASAPKI
jgi:hypothetical protein